jgi:hypothetical protein
MAQSGSGYISNSSLVVGAIAAEMGNASSVDISAGTSLNSSISSSFAEFGGLFRQVKQSRGLLLVLIALLVLPLLLVGIVPAVDFLVSAVTSLLQQLKISELALDSIALFLCGAHLVWCAIEHSLVSRM